MKITELQMDALKEICNIGAGNAATALSRLLNKRVSLQIPLSRLLPLSEVADCLGGAEAKGAAVRFHLSGSLSGNILLAFRMEEALRLTDLLIDQPSTINRQRLDPLAQSALSELGNISVGAYLAALSQVAHMKLTHSVPGFAIDMIQAVLDETLSLMALSADEAVVVETKFLVEQEEIRGDVVFLLSPEGLQALLANLGGLTG